MSLHKRSKAAMQGELYYRWVNLRISITPKSLFLSPVHVCWRTIFFTRRTIVSAAILSNEWKQKSWNALCPHECGRPFNSTAHCTRPSHCA